MDIALSLRIGVDLGGTKIEVAAFDPAGQILLQHRSPTPQGDYNATLDAVVELVLAAEGELGTSATVGIGIPGAESRATGRIKNANSTCLIGQPLRLDLEARLQREIRLANDANCFALSEAIDGASAGAEVVLGVILGTGCGAGIVVRGQVWVGSNAIAGEWGHNPLPWPQDDECPGPACYCGRHGCLETWLSGPGLSSDLERHTGRRLGAAEIAMLDDTDCKAAMERYEDRLARGLSQVINILDPDVIVLGGGLSNLACLYENVPRRWGRYVFSDTVATRLVRPLHGDSSGVRGAAWLWGCGETP